MRVHAFCAGAPHMPTLCATHAHNVRHTCTQSVTSQHEAPHVCTLPYVERVHTCRASRNPLPQRLPRPLLWRSPAPPHTLHTCASSSSVRCLSVASEATPACDNCTAPRSFKARSCDSWHAKTDSWCHGMRQLLRLKLVKDVSADSDVARLCKRRGSSGGAERDAPLPR
eukprot:363437-Chlamydomonas_euryale.AAC.4